MGYWEKNLQGLKPTLLMVLVEAVFALVNLLYKLAANDGMNLSVLVAYRFILGTAFILPVALFVERKKRPKLTWKIALYGFLCGLFGGSLGQNLYLRSLVLTSATFSSAMMNLIPAITFIVGISLRLEKLKWNTVAGKAKVAGTVLGIAGAMVLTFYKGPDLHVWDTNINLLNITRTHHDSRQQLWNHHSGHNFILGAVLALVGCVFYSFWLIVQAKAAEVYPCPYSITAMMTLSASFQGIVFSLCTERDWSKWRLGWDIRLLTVIVAGILGAGLMFTLVAWCVRMRGPHFVSSFQPLMLLMVALGGSLFMEEKLHVGIVVGAIVIVAGLNAVLWGKNKELKLNDNDEENQSALPPESDEAATGKLEEEEEEGPEEERRSQANSEILAVYMYP